MGKVTCSVCKKSCKGQAVRLQDKYLHVKCFKCKECKKQLASGGFFSKDDSFYCPEDYQRLFGTKCSECGEFVEGEVITALGNTYHKNCFSCTKCQNKFGPGDKVTFNGKDYLCNSCLELYEADQKASKSPQRTSRPVSTNGHAGFQGIPVTSTPARPLQAAIIDGPLGSPLSESEISDNQLRVGGPTGQYNGPISPISIASSGPPSPGKKYERPSTSDVFYDEGVAGQSGSDRENPFRTQSEDDSVYDSQGGGRLSPIQQIDSSSSYEPKWKVDYSRFYKGSYLKATDPKAAYKRGPSLNTATKPKSPHFHRPENFSYRSVRQDFKFPMKKGDAGMMSKRKIEDQEVPLGKEEAIKQSRYPEGQKLDDKQYAIERADWPAPPAAAAAYPELLREHPLGRVRVGFYAKDDPDATDGGPVSPRKSFLDDEEEQENIDPRVQRDIEELSKMKNSGVGKLILQDLEKKKTEPILIDPVSASRTPSAMREPPYKTRYEVHVFASPSRDLDFRPRTHSMDDELLGKKFRTSLPISNYPGRKSR